MSTRSYGTKELELDFGPLTFGDALQSFRQGEEWTQAYFAKKLGISPQSLCDLEKGRRIPTPSRASKIAKKLGEPTSFWVQLALQDYLKKEKVKLNVSVA